MGPKGMEIIIIYSERGESKLSNGGCHFLIPIKLKADFLCQTFKSQSLQVFLNKSKSGTHRWKVQDILRQIQLIWCEYI